MAKTSWNMPISRACVSTRRPLRLTDTRPSTSTCSRGRLLHGRHRFVIVTVILEKAKQIGPAPNLHHGRELSAALQDELHHCIKRVICIS